MNGTATVAPGERDHHPRLHAAWSRDRGFLGWLAAVNHKNIGMRFILTGLAFFLVGGVLALLVRTQLIVPENSFLSAEAFNELFTMHGTTMMFLFAVPILEGLAMYLLPLMLGTRDLPFPRLNAFGYWCYLFGGLLVISSLLIGDAPSEGWFAYVPLSGPVFAPGSGMDIWLLGITFVEISAIAAAIEILVSFFARRAPGMSLTRIPVFAWSTMVTAAMIAVAFPVLLAGSLLLEIERLTGTRLFDAAAGGDPLLWQHLFWFFGHPEVYIILVPAIGVVSTVVPVFSRRPLAGYPLVVAALIAIGLVSFGLWVHHMFTTGLSLVALSIFAMAGFLIAIPSGIQVFAWLATMWKGKPEFRPPMLFVLGFLQIFILGGITGVMVSAVPFNWAVHDSYFIVAHLHYVLIGGMVFPLFGGIYYWFPKAAGRLLSEKLGLWSFWTMLVGFNTAFFPQHIAGMQGMPRRVYTYTELDGWATLNLISTIGAYLFAIGVLLTIVNLVVSRRHGRESGPDPWKAGGLEWAVESPPPAYNFRRPPVVYSADPLWDRSQREVRADSVTEKVADELADIDHHVREVFETSAVDARPIAIAHLPGPSLIPVSAAAALFVALLGVLLYEGWLVGLGAIAGVCLLVVWAYGTVAQPDPELQRSLPVVHTGAGAWGAGFGILSLSAALGALLFAYLQLAAHNSVWPPAGVDNPEPGLGLLACLASLGAFAACAGAMRSGKRERRGPQIGCTAVAVVMSMATALLALFWFREMEIGATSSAYASIVAVLLGFASVLGIALFAITAVVLWRMATTGEPLNLHARVSLRVTTILAAFTTVAVILIVLAVWLVPGLSG